MNKIAPYKIIILIFALLLVVGSLVYTKYSISRTEVKQVTNIYNKEFGNEHFQYIIVDTFVALLQKSYGSNITVQTNNNQVNATLSNAGVITKDFFNSNDKILALKKSDFGFSINYDKAANKIEASFNMVNGAVPVPNDVMIKLVDKTYNK